MSIDLKTISALREKTGAGIGDCQKALEEAGGNIEQAIEVLRKKGELKAAKKADRVASEGIVAIAKDGGKVSGVVINCETDFVARNEDFIAEGNKLATKLLADGQDGFAEFADSVIKNELVVKIGENLKLGDFKLVEAGIVGTYIHSNKKLAAIVAMEGGNQALADELAMQVAAMNPAYVSPADVPAELVEKEKEIYREQLKNENKPEAIWDKIIAGKLNKYYEDVCLLNQIYIKDDAKHIADLVKEVGDAQVKSFSILKV